MAYSGKIFFDDDKIEFLFNDGGISLMIDGGWSDLT